MTTAKFNINRHLPLRALHSLHRCIGLCVETLNLSSLNCVCALDFVQISTKYHNFKPLLSHYAVSQQKGKQLMTSFSRTFILSIFCDGFWSNQKASHPETSLQMCGPLYVCVFVVSLVFEPAAVLPAFTWSRAMFGQWDLLCVLKGIQYLLMGDYVT